MDGFLFNLIYSYTKRGTIVRLVSAIVVFVVSIILLFYCVANPSYADSVLYYNPLSTTQQTFFYFVLSVPLFFIISQSLYLKGGIRPSRIISIAIAIFSILVSFLVVDVAVFVVHSFLPKNYTVSLGYVVDKRCEGLSSPPYVLTVNTDYTPRFNLEIRHGAYKEITRGDTVLVRITTDGDTSVLNYKPSQEAIAKYRVPLMYRDGKLSKSHRVNSYTDEQKRVFLKWSYLVVGSVYEIIDENPYRLVRVGVADSLTSKHILEGSMPGYVKINSQIHVGSKVILRVAEGNPMINVVYDWFPDSASLDRYAEPQPFDPKAKPAINISPYRPINANTMLNSFYCLGRVYGKYEDENLGMHFEIGLSDSLLVDRVYKSESMICT